MKGVDELKKLFRFAFVGAAATLVHLGVAQSLLLLTGLNAYIANIAGFLCAFLLSYVGHYFFTFRHTGAHSAAIAKFLMLAIGGFALNNVILTTGILLGVPAYISLFFATAVPPLAVFLVSRFVIFTETR